MTTAMSALASLLWLSCADKYNPFGDYGNADAEVVYRSFGDGDTVEIFAAETVQVIVTVKELVSRFTVSAEGNRLWTSADTTITNGNFPSEPFDFIVSFNDTGRQAVVVSVYKSDGTVTRDSLRLYAVSPLHQDSLRAHEGDSVLLRTPPVADRGVAYYWSFGESARFISQSCSTRVALSVPLLTGRGAVWVSDATSRSPADSFSFALLDTVKPEILCVTNGYVGADTVYTGDSWLTFKVRISDRGDDWVDSASVNGVPFDRKENRVYYKLFDRLSSRDAGDPLRVDVYAVDNFLFRNEATRTFWIVYSDSISRTEPARIVVLNPEGDTTVTSASAYRVFGSVENYSLDTVNLTLLAYVNDSALSVVRQARGTSTDWDWDLDLRPGTNTIRIAAFDARSGGAVTWTSFVIVRDSSVTDAVAPRIIAVNADGKPAQGLYATTPTVVLEVKAFDEETAIDSLIVNGKQLRPSTPTSISYFDTLLLNHVTTGNEIVVRAVDVAGNAVQKTAVVFRNRRPLIETRPGPSSVSAESLYVDTVRAGDPDGDTVWFDKAGGPAGLTVESNGAILWTPALGDTGMHTVTVRVWDGYQPVHAVYNLFVYPPWAAPPQRVRFATRAQDFPASLEAGGDTMRVVLRVAAGTGIPPYIFSARFMGADTSIIARPRDSVVTWVPDTADTGYRQLIVVVQDQFPSRDTIYPRILVVPPNRPPFVLLHYGGDTLPDGALNINAAQGYDTLVFAINDEDNQLTERHDFAVRQARSSVVSRIDSALVDSYRVVIDARVFDGYDTLIAVLTDQGGYSDTLVTVLYYGEPPDTPAFVSPGDTVSLGDSTVVLSWQGSDPDGDSLSYGVYVDTTRVMVAPAATTSGTSFTLRGLSSGTTYYWRIVAHDWKSSTPGPTRQFLVVP